MDRQRGEVRQRRDQVMYQESCTLMDPGDPISSCYTPPIPTSISLVDAHTCRLIRTSTQYV